MACLLSSGFVQKRGNGREPPKIAKISPLPLMMSQRRRTSSLTSQAKIFHKKWIEKKPKTHSWLRYEKGNVCLSFPSLSIASGEAPSFIYFAAVLSGQIPTVSSAPSLRNSCVLFVYVSLYRLPFMLFTSSPAAPFPMIYFFSRSLMGRLSICWES